MTLPSYLRPVLWYHLISGRSISPWRHVHNISEIDIAFLKQEKIRGIILDVDNTLTHHHKSEVPGEIRTAFADLSREFSCCIFSNCGKTRFRELQRIFSIPVVEHGYKKPSASGFQRAMQLLGTRAGQTVMVGDRTLTDILGANRLGIRTILVDPLCSDEPALIAWMRKLEHWRLNLLRKKKEK